MTTTVSGTQGVDKVKDGILVIADTKDGEAVGFQRMQLFAAKATTSGTSVDFSPADGTGIPSWAKRITIALAGVSTNGASVVQVQLGHAGGIENTGYLVSVGLISGAAAGGSNITTGFPLDTDGSEVATTLRGGIVSLVNLSGSTWAASASIGASNTTCVINMGGSKTLSGALYRIRLTTANGTDTFDAGSISILVEGYA